MSNIENLQQEALNPWMIDAETNEFNIVTQKQKEPDTEEEELTFEEERLLEVIKKQNIDINKLYYSFTTSEDKLKDEVIEDTLEQYFKEHEAPLLHLSNNIENNETIKKQVKKLGRDVQRAIRKELQTVGNKQKEKEKFKTFDALDDYTIREIIKHITIIKNVNYALAQSTEADGTSGETTELMLYTDDGTYKNADKYINTLTVYLDPNNKTAKSNRIDSIKSDLFCTEATFSDPDFVPVKNGLYNVKTGELEEYTPDRIITRPIPVNFNPAATNPIFIMEDGEEFNVEEFLLSLANNNEDIKAFFWSVLSSIVYVYRPFYRAYFLYDEKGNAGKGTFKELCTNLMGVNNVCQMDLEAFNAPFYPDNLPYTHLITGDENDGFLNNMSKFKSICSGDTVGVNRKNKPFLNVSYRGRIIQCMNSLPRSASKDGGLMRRYCFIPFMNNFSKNQNSKIKTDYIKDERVLEYILYKAIMLNVQPEDITADKDPQIMKDVYNEFLIANDSLIRWWNDFKDPWFEELKNKLGRIPYQLLYETYEDYIINESKAGRKFKKTITDVQEFRRQFLNKIYDVELKAEGWQKTKKGEPFRLTVNMFDVYLETLSRFNCPTFSNPNAINQGFQNGYNNRGHLNPMLKESKQNRFTGIFIN